MSAETDAEMTELRDRAARAADHIARISQDVRSVGDMPLIVMSEEGVTRPQMTLADELWMVAYTLDADAALKVEP